MQVQSRSSLLSCSVLWSPKRLEALFKFSPFTIYAPNDVLCLPWPENNIADVSQGCFMMRQHSLYIENHLQQVDWSRVETSRSETGQWKNHYRACPADNSRGAKEKSQSLACQRPLTQAEYIQKTRPFKGKPFMAFWLCSQAFAGILLCRNSFFSFVKAHSSTMQKRISPLFPYCFISSGNFPFQLVPGDYHLALMP